MTTRRSRGDGALFWSERRQRWIGEITTGYDGRGKRIYRRVSDRTKSGARAKLKELQRDHDDGLPVGPQNYTVGEAVQNWLKSGLSNRDPATATKCRRLADRHIVPALGKRKLRELSADEVDRWLEAKAKCLSTDTLRQLHSVLRRSVARAQAHDKVKRNVVMLCIVPTGQPGRESKSFTLAQAEAVLEAAEGTAMYAYIVLSLLIGARTEELRALTWDHVNLKGDPDARPPVPPSIMVWRSVRAGGKTKTRKSYRTLKLPNRCVVALEFQLPEADPPGAPGGRGGHGPDLQAAGERVDTQLDTHGRQRPRRTTRAGPLSWEPPIGIEPMTYSLRVNRSAD